MLQQNITIVGKCLNKTELQEDNEPVAQYYSRTLSQYQNT